ncbi:hypothetical protein BBB44_09935 [Bordetella bronchiseptica]|nr:hypothetical protein BBB44_09935 [Bordetella bronchiseptica]
MASASISISHSGSDRPLTMIQEEGGGLSGKRRRSAAAMTSWSPRVLADVDAQHDDVLHRGAGGRQYAFDVVQRGFGLLVQAGAHGALLGVDADLAGQQDATLPGDDQSLAEAVLQGVEDGVGIEGDSGHAGSCPCAGE